MGGKLDSFEDLYLKYKNQICSFFYYNTSNYYVAEELTQDVFIKAYKNINGFKGKTSFKNWLYIIARNQLKDYYRKNSKKTEVELDEFIMNNMISSYGNPEDEYERDLKIKSLLKVINNLKEDQRTVIILCEFQNVSYVEIAEIMDWSLSKVKITIYRTRLKIRECLKEEGDMV